MLKKRVIPTMLLLGKRLVKGTKFNNHIDVGNPSTTMRGFNAQNPDEICLINLNSDKDSFSFLVNTVASVAEECRVPITIGGGIDSVAKVKALIKSGADKVFVNSGLHYHKQLMSEISEEVGGQALVAGIDYKYINGKPVVVFRNGEETTALHPLDYAESIFRYVSCEIFLTCVDRDGGRMGYDIALFKKLLLSSVLLPLLRLVGLVILDTSLSCLTLQMPLQHHAEASSISQITTQCE